jgi:hypothetical protein
MRVAGCYNSAAFGGNTMSEYTKQAEDFLTRHNLTFRATLVGSDCPRFCEDATKSQKMDEVNKYPRKSHIHGKHYNCQIARKDGGQISFDFWNSYADEEFNALGCKDYREGGTSVFKYGKVKGKSDLTGRSVWKPAKAKTVEAYDLLACVEKSDPGTFEDFCSNFGYDSDSRKAFDVYLAVQQEAAKIQRFFTEEELKELQEIQ